MDESTAIRLVGMLQSATSLLDFIANQVVNNTSQAEADEIKRLLGNALGATYEISVILYKQHIKSVPKEMRPPGADTDEDLRVLVDRWAVGLGIS